MTSSREAFLLSEEINLLSSRITISLCESASGESGYILEQRIKSRWMEPQNNKAWNKKEFSRDADTQALAAEFTEFVPWCW